MGEDYNSLDELTSQELLQSDTGLTISVSRNVSAEDREPLWEMVQQGFIELNRRSYEKQDMTYEEFSADLDSPNTLAYLARDADNRAVGYMAVHLGLDDIVWTDTSFLKTAQEEVDSKAQPFYVGTLVVPPDIRGTDVALRLLQGALLHFNQVNLESSQNSLCFFDCADANYPWLGEFVQNAAKPTSDFVGVETKVSELRTEYWASDDLSPGRPQKLAQEPTDSNRYTILDKQHYYAMSVTPQAY